MNLSSILGTTLDIFFLILLSLGVLAGSMIWVAVLAATWTSIAGFLKTYKKVSKELDAEEEASNQPEYYN